MKKELKRIEALYLDGKLFEDTDELGADGYWDLAGELADMFVDEEVKVAGMDVYQLFEQLQEGFYQMFQKLLVRGESIGKI